MTKVVLIGSGNVAKHLHDVFSVSETIELAQVVGRNEMVLKDFGNAVKTTTDFSKIEESDIYIIAVSDDAIASVSKKLGKTKGLVVHTSGGKSIAILQNHIRNGVFYPLQTFSKNRKVDFNKVPICVEANSDSDLKLLKELALHISEKVFEVSSEQRKALHLSAVFVNNFTNHLYYVGNRICEEHQLPFEILYPLIEETVHKLSDLSPRDAQTGPARRGDTKTVNAHLNQLKKLDENEIYALLSQSIQKTYGKEL